MSQAIAITACGMVSGVGLNAAASCAAIRCALDNFQETRFMDDGGEWLMGCAVPLEHAWRGKSKLIKMAALAIQECLQEHGNINVAETPLLLCLPETERPGRVFSDDNAFFLELQQELALSFHEKSRVIPMGRVAAGVALQRARTLIHTQGIPQVLIAGVDSLLVSATLETFMQREYVLTSNNSDGFIPGEAGAAILVEPVYRQEAAQLICHGIGFGTEKAHVDSEEPLRAEGLTTAVKGALVETNLEFVDLDFRITSISGKQYYFKEDALFIGRILRQHKESFDIWHPADCLGEVGSTIGLVMIIVAKFAAQKNYADGKHILINSGNEDGKRAALVLSWQDLPRGV